MSVDHLFIDLELGYSKGAIPSIFAFAAARTTDRGKVIASAADSGESTDFEKILDSLAAITVPFSAPYIVVAVSADLKRTALRDACRKECLPDPFKGRAWLDFGQVAWPLALAELVPNRSLDTVGAHFRVPRSAPHAGTLTGDCAYLAEVYWEMARSYRTALGAEARLRETAHNIGGEVVSSLRRLIGV